MAFPRPFCAARCSSPWRGGRGRCTRLPSCGWLASGQPFNVSSMRGVVFHAGSLNTTTCCISVHPRKRGRRVTPTHPDSGRSTADYGGSGGEGEQALTSPLITATPASAHDAIVPPWHQSRPGPVPSPSGSPRRHARHGPVPQHAAPAAKPSDEPGPCVTSTRTTREGRARTRDP
jgi:hypothetical protein